MILTNGNKTLIQLGAGDVFMFSCEDEDGNKYIALRQGDEGEVGRLEPVSNYIISDFKSSLPTIFNTVEAKEPIVIIESSSAESIDVLIAALDDYKKMIS